LEDPSDEFEVGHHHAHDHDHDEKIGHQHEGDEEKDPGQSFNGSATGQHNSQTELIF
jgi:hypothetical protein